MSTGISHRLIVLYPVPREARLRFSGEEGSLWEFYHVRIFIALGSLWEFYRVR